MAFKTMYESAFYRIEADVENNIIRSKWLKSVNAEEVEAGGTMLYEVLRDTRITRVIANAQAFETLSAEAKEWMSTTFYELLSKTKLQKIARVLPLNVFYRIALESVATRADALGITKFEVKNFTNDEDALMWVEI
ncbi:hypothetical protein [Pontibacter sp. SGAir0037]|uniref:hypothetical protein n=1 Tax=Pontibacter sp. SGAir0037 TaxID=2571030 RepID=UPI0010CD301A|nr:hypothetical protein [Pontibacter sp. SGAir0037]QCR22863.1 hypothetical protein C1N53_11250 [Pontibacter sp. SGAir0037]